MVLSSDSAWQRFRRARWSVRPRQRQHFLSGEKVQENDKEIQICTVPPCGQNDAKTGVRSCGALIGTLLTYWIQKVTTFDYDMVSRRNVRAKY